MAEMFKTVMILSLFGFVLTALLLCLKPITAKKFPARWQYLVWIAVMLSMLIPVYKWIPELVPDSAVSTPTQVVQEVTQAPAMDDTIIIPETPIIYRQIPLHFGVEIRVLDLLALIWAGGCFIFLCTIFASYGIYVAKKRKNALSVAENSLLNQVKEEMGIKRNIRIRMTADVQSPMLVGLFCPIIYLPCREIPDEQMAMVFRHELTHYKRGDLAIKWLALLTNAVHWFNPLAYLLCANISESCEVSCDMAVTKKMTDDEQKLYMQTILNLLE